MVVSRRRLLVLGGLLAAAPARVVAQPGRYAGRAVRLGVLHLAPPATSPSASDESGLAASPARPGGNVTGLRVYAGEVFGKYVALAKELVPSLKELGIFWGYGPPAFPPIETPLALDEMQRAAESLNLHLRVWQNPDAAALAASLRDAANARMQALFVTSATAQAVSAAVARIARFSEARRRPRVFGRYRGTGGARPSCRRASS